MNLRKHWRFLAGLALGAAAAAVVPVGAMQRLLIGGDLLFAFYLLTTWLTGRQLTPDDLRRHASEEDEGALIIVLLALAAVAVSIVSIFDALAAGGARWWQIGALISVPLGWLTLHTMFALRYAHLWYVPGDALAPPTNDNPPKAGGLDFPDCDEPGLIEFLYYSFTIGMTAQTSDTGVTTTEMRRLTLWHAGVSFLYNTVLIALSVNAAMTVAGGGG